MASSSLTTCVFNTEPVTDDPMDDLTEMEINALLLEDVNIAESHPHHRRPIVEQEEHGQPRQPGQPGRGQQMEINPLLDVNLANLHPRHQRPIVKEEERRQPGQPERGQQNQNRQHFQHDGRQHANYNEFHRRENDQHQNINNRVNYLRNRQSQFMEFLYELSSASNIYEFRRRRRARGRRQNNQQQDQ